VLVDVAGHLGERQSSSPSGPIPSYPVTRATQQLGIGPESLRL
jgi:hypothetical protein